MRENDRTIPRGAYNFSSSLTYFVEFFNRTLEAKINNGIVCFRFICTNYGKWAVKNQSFIIFSSLQNLRNSNHKLHKIIIKT